MSGDDNDVVNPGVAQLVDGFLYDGDLPQAQESFRRHPATLAEALPPAGRKDYRRAYCVHALLLAMACPNTDSKRVKSASEMAPISAIRKISLASTPCPA